MRTSSTKDSFYLDWLMDHKKDFQWPVLEKLGKEAAEEGVALRPVNLLKLERLLRAGRPAQSQRLELPKQLVFG
jgi:hypothetical protein